MARRKIIVCDGCGAEVATNTGGRMRVTATDPRKTGKEADLCDTCVSALPGHDAKRRGRKPAAKTAA